MTICVKTTGDYRVNNGTGIGLGRFIAALKISGAPVRKECDLIKRLRNVKVEKETKEEKMD
jgi:hypothetical protein